MNVHALTVTRSQSGNGACYNPGAVEVCYQWFALPMEKGGPLPPQ
ncbi:hypothetical protein NPIL_57711, partial [Nephila pilipes]